MLKTDLLIIGSGVAGLSLALKAAQLMPDRKILVLTKADLHESNTNFAQGGIAAVTNLHTDSFEKHISDTLNAGAGLCDQEIVEMVIREAPERINELVEWQMPFDKTESGDFDLGREGGHSENRVLHHKDCTGAAMSRILADRVKELPNIEIQTHCFVIDLIISPNEELFLYKKCSGAWFFDIRQQKIIKVLSRATVIATGGAGQIYRNTTNPVIATGDGIAIAYRAGAMISNMEFVQFHPTALYNPGENPSFLISEAVRGAGAVLRNKEGFEFMCKYDSRGSLAPRDIVARGIDFEIQKDTSSYVFLDARKISPGQFLKHFPNIAAKCREIGIDVQKEMIPVVPAAHYMCGGINVNKFGQTNIPNLFACGECSSTGLHGANRLASNSLLEALVYAHRIAVRSSEIIQVTEPDHFDTLWFAQPVFEPSNLKTLNSIKHEVQTLMTRKANIVRNRIHLHELMNQLRKLKDDTDLLKNAGPISPQLCELSNLITVSLLVAKGAIFRLKSLGAHYVKPTELKDRRSSIHHL